MQHHRRMPGALSFTEKSVQVCVCVCLCLYLLHTANYLLFLFLEVSTFWLVLPTSKVRFRVNLVLTLGLELGLD